jgi:Rv2525c-like, glycoside hydrolase-like domain
VKKRIWMPACHRAWMAGLTESTRQDEREVTMSVFLGFDRLAYPGDGVMQLLRSQGGVSFTGFYLGPAPSQRSTGWMQKRSFLKDLGFGFAPVYVGQQQPPGPGSHILTAHQGTIDGADAVRLARHAGFPESSVLYLDIETGPPVQRAFLDYYAAWVQSVIDNGFTPGVYCSHLLAHEFLARDNRPQPWVFHLKFSTGHVFSLPLPAPDPSQSSFPDAKVLQYAQNCTLKLDATSVKPIDLDSALTADPSTL